MSKQLQYCSIVQRFIESQHIEKHLKPTNELMQAHKCSTCENGGWQRCDFAGDGSSEHARDPNPPLSLLRCYCTATHSYVPLSWWKIQTNPTQELVGNEDPKVMLDCALYIPLMK